MTEVTLPGFARPALQSGDGFIAFGAGSLVTGWLGDRWSRRHMMVIFFAGMGVSSLVIALCTNKWQIGAALTLMGAFASIYHPVGIPMLVQKAKNPGFTIGVNGLAGNMGIAIAAEMRGAVAVLFMTNVVATRTLIAAADRKSVV